jgi:hypothetical protein
MTGTLENQNNVEQPIPIPLIHEVFFFFLINVIYFLHIRLAQQVAMMDRHITPPAYYSKGHTHVNP